MKPIAITPKESVVAYARYSDDGQREESIEAQLRAIREYAKKNNYRIIEEYIDRGRSGTNDRRAEFQRMINDSKKRVFTKVIVHKLDRFSRNMDDTIKYTTALKANGVDVISTAEQFDDSPMGEVMRLITQVMAQFYSRNLAGEVEKGKKENAYKGMHVGGIPPLGYDVDRSTLKLIINEKEAESIRLIFSMYLEGQGYGKIIDKLNFLGYKTKRGHAFGKNSLHDILRNEKYTGAYIYNRSTPVTADGKFNRHKIKPDEEIIRVENAHPAIISREDFERIALKMADNRKNAPSHTAKEVYLLSGKIICGECGSRYNGINRPARENFPQYISYRCSRRNGSLKCKNSEIKRESLELFVLDKLANYLFSDEMSERLFRGYHAYFLTRRTVAKQELEVVQREIENVSADIEKLVDLMIQTNSAATGERLQAMEDRKQELKERETELEGMARAVLYKKSTYMKAFREAKKRLLEGKLEKTRDIINQFVNRVEIHKDRITVYFNFDGTEDATAPDATIPQARPMRGQPAVFPFADINAQIDTMSGRPSWVKNKPQDQYRVLPLRLRFCPVLRPPDGKQYSTALGLWQWSNSSRQ